VNLGNKIRELGQALYGRLDKETVDDAVSYVDFGECRLALRILCDQIYEYGIRLKQEEFQKLDELGKKLNIDIERVESLKGLMD
jgi:hypothetical protein